MKILLVSTNLIQAERMKRIFQKDHIDSLSLIYNGENIDEIRSEMEKSDFKIVIINRVKCNLDDFLKNISDREFFILAENRNEVRVDDLQLFSKVSCTIFIHPINYGLLNLKIKSVHFFRELENQPMLEFKEIRLDLNSRILSYQNRQVFLKNKEFELVKYMMINQGKVLSRINILENVWDMNADVMTNTVDVHVSRIRNILKKQFELDDVIKTVQCIGYVLM